MTKSIPLEAGQKFNRLTVIKLDHIEKYISPNDAISNKEYYLCKCDCGNQIIVRKDKLIVNTKSCGCLKKEKTSMNGLNNKIHGLTKTKLYKIWRGMKTRCYNKKDKHFKNYGGRGIIMCNEWLNDFQVFYDWSINNSYKENKGRNILTIDRINVNGNYESSNCRWVTQKEQCQNKRNNNLITYNGEIHCLKEWSDILGINKATLYNRIIKYNWSVEKSFTKLVKKT